jgi:tetratricopeptide (TPR) repeat protein
VFPEAPAWGFPPDGQALDLIRLLAEKKRPGEDDATSWTHAFTWELLRSLYRASHGPADPRVCACMSRAALAISRKPGCLAAAAALAAGACEVLCRAQSCEAGGGERDTGGGPPEGGGSDADGDAGMKGSPAADRDGNAGMEGSPAADRDANAGRTESPAADRDGYAGRAEGSAADRDGNAGRAEGSAADRDGNAGRAEGSAADRNGNAGAAGDSVADGDGRTLLLEHVFALGVLAASRAAIERQHGRDSGIPFPAQAYSLRTAMNPGIAPSPASEPEPGPDQLRSALAAAERDGARSPETLAIRSRLGEALADAEAWARASSSSLFLETSLPSGESGKSGTSWESRESGDSSAPDTLRNSGAAPGASPPCPPGEESAEALLRSSSAGLDALLGRTHPCSLDARERLARYLSGGSGPGIPPSPFEEELPPPDRIREAAEMFTETAAARAEAGARAAEGALVEDLQSGKATGLPPDLAGLGERLRRSGDVKAFAAAAASAGCSRFCGTGQELPSFFVKAAKAAWDVLGEAHPVTLRFLTIAGETMLSANRGEEAYLHLSLVISKFEDRPCLSSREQASAYLGNGRGRHACKERLAALGSYAEALEVLEEADSCGVPVPDAARARPGLPPGRLGRDLLLTRCHIAELLLQMKGPLTAAGVLAPCLDSLTRLPPACEGPGIRPWPAALSGTALYFAGMAARENGDDDGAAELLRRALDNLGLSQNFPGCPKDVLGELRTLLERRGDAGSLREAALLSEREAEHLASMDGPDSPGALRALLLAARHRESAGDADAALAHHRKVLAARKRRLGPMAEETRRSRDEIRRIEMQKGPDMD